MTEFPRILLFGNPELIQSTQKVEGLNPEVLSKISEMIAILYSFHAIGLAGPQIGYNKKIIVWDYKWIESKQKYNDVHVMINPEITNESIEDIQLKEGCLSIPEVYPLIYRSKDIEVKYFNENWEEKKEKYSGIESRVIQHEIDHLNGILMIDKMPKDQRKQIFKHLNMIKQFSTKEQTNNDSSNLQSN